MGSHTRRSIMLPPTCMILTGLAAAINTAFPSPATAIPTNYFVNCPVPGRQPPAAAAVLAVTASPPPIPTPTPALSTYKTFIRSYKTDAKAVFVDACETATPYFGKIASPENVKWWAVTKPSRYIAFVLGGEDQVEYAYDELARVYEALPGDWEEFSVLLLASIFIHIVWYSKKTDDSVRNALRTQRECIDNQSCVIAAKDKMIDDLRGRIFENRVQQEVTMRNASKTNDHFLILLAQLALGVPQPPESEVESETWKGLKAIYENEKEKVALQKKWKHMQVKEKICVLRWRQVLSFINLSKGITAINCKGLKLWLKQMERCQ